MYLISYDISLDSVRNKVAKELENFGKRVQYSVFECDITEKRYAELYGRLVYHMNESEEGNIRIYKLCGKCQQMIQTIGIDDMENNIAEDGIYFV